MVHCFHYFYSPALKKWGCTGFALPFRHSVILSFCHCHSVIIQMKLEYLRGQLASLDQILYEASLWWGKGCIRFWDRLDQNLGFQQKHPFTYNGENNVGTFSLLFLSDLFSNLQVTRTGIKSRTSSNFGQIGPLPTELGALEHLKISHRLIMGKWFLQGSLFIFYQIFVKLARNQDRHYFSDEVEFWPDRTSHFGVTCPWGRIKFSIDLLWNLQVQLTLQMKIYWVPCGCNSSYSFPPIVSKLFHRLFWNFSDVFCIEGRCACNLDIILCLFFLTFSALWI